MPLKSKTSLRGKGSITLNLPCFPENWYTYLLQMLNQTKQFDFRNRPEEKLLLDSLFGDEEWDRVVLESGSSVVCHGVRLAYQSDHHLKWAFKVEWYNRVGKSMTNKI